MAPGVCSRCVCSLLCVCTCPHLPQKSANTHTHKHTQNELRKAETERSKGKHLCACAHTHTHTHTHTRTHTHTHAHTHSTAYSVIAGLGDREAIFIVSFSEVVTQELPKREKKKSCHCDSTTHTFGRGLCHFNINTLSFQAMLCTLRYRENKLICMLRGWTTTL